MRQLEMKIATLATLRALLHGCSFHLNVQTLYESIHEQKSLKKVLQKEILINITLKVLFRP